MFSENIKIPMQGKSIFYGYQGVQENAAFLLAPKQLHLTSFVASDRIEAPGSKNVNRLFHPAGTWKQSC